MAEQVTTSLAPVVLTSDSPATLTNWCAYNAHGIRIGVVFAFLGQWAVAGRHYGGVPYLYTLEGAKARVELLNPVARWDVVEVEQ